MCRNKLVEQIEQYQHSNGLPSYAVAVRKICSYALALKKFQDDSKFITKKKGKED